MSISKPYPPTLINYDQWNTLVDMMAGGQGRVQGFNYLIQKVGTQYQAINGTTGKIDFSGLDASTVIQSAIDALPTLSNYTELGEVVIGGKLGWIHIKGSISSIPIASDTIIPPGSVIKMTGDAVVGCQLNPQIGTVLDFTKGSNGTLLDFPILPYTYPHSKICLEGLTLMCDDDLTVYLIDTRGVFTGSLKDLNCYGVNHLYPVYGIYARAGGANHIFSIENFDAVGLHYGILAQQNHITLREASITDCERGIAFGSNAFIRSGLYDLQLMDNVIDLDLTFGSGSPIMIKKLYLEHGGIPASTTVKTGGRKLIVDGLVWSPDNAVFSNFFETPADITILDGMAYAHGGSPVLHLFKNNGTSTGTGAQQTIAHGCSFTPTYDEVFLSERSTGLAIPYQSAAPDATNIYITATLNKDYNWKVEKA